MKNRSYYIGSLFLLITVLLSSLTLLAQENKNKEFTKIHIQRYHISDPGKAAIDAITHRIDLESEKDCLKEINLIKVEDVSSNEELDLIEDRVSGSNYEKMTFQVKELDPITDPNEHSTIYGRVDGVTPLMTCDPFTERCFVIANEYFIQPKYCPAEEYLSEHFVITEDGKYMYGTPAPASDTIDYKPISEITFYYQANKAGLIMEGIDLRKFLRLPVNYQKQLIDGMMEVWKANNCYPPEYFIQ